MDQLLRGHPLVDRVVTPEFESLLQLRAQKFDVAYVVDKSQKAVGIAQFLNAMNVRGWVTHQMTGAILPATPQALELWELGLDNHRKFKVNQKPETQLTAEALGLEYGRDAYSLALTDSEQELVHDFRRQWSQDAGEPIIGFNTGCGPALPAKKWTVEFHRRVIKEALARGHRNLVLLGGPEDLRRNQQIGEGLPVRQSPLDQGIRVGSAAVAACDIVVTGDSLGMHLAIAHQKFVVAWFGPSCIQEIDLFERGIALQTKAGCSPCWKRHCSESLMCYDQVELSEVMRAIHQGVLDWQLRSSLSRPHFSETFSSPSL